MAASRTARCATPLLLAALLTAKLAGQAFHRRPPNDYERTEAANAATLLNAQLADGDASLESDGVTGRLLPLLEALEIPTSSQTLVFSKTSLQRHRVSPSNPRAVYFNGDAYVAWIPGAASLEIAVGDDQLGLAFYTLTQDPAQPPVLVRDDTCLRCHASSRTHEEPGLLLRSVFPDEDGDPITSAGDSDMDYRQPLSERWGGWIVTGQIHGPHRGNGVAVEEGHGSYQVPSTFAADLSAFAGRFDPNAYPVATSDIGALLALEQQATIQNLAVRASAQARYLLARDRRMNELLDERGVRAQTRDILDALAKDLAAALLLEGEADLVAYRCAPDPSFANDYAALWPRSKSGVQLGALDLRERTFRAPLSPMAHAPALTRLPAPLRERVLRRLAVAIQRGVPPGDVRLPRDVRRSLDRHLHETLPGWPSTGR